MNKDKMTESWKERLFNILHSESKTLPISTKQYNAIFTLISQVREDSLNELKEKLPKGKEVLHSKDFGDSTMNTVYFGGICTNSGFNSCLKQVEEIIKELNK